MSEERIQITIEQELEFYKSRADYASQLLTLVVSKLGGTVDLTIEDLEADLSGVHIEDLDGDGLRIIVFKDEEEA